MRGCREDYATALVESAIFQTSTPPAVFGFYVAGEVLVCPRRHNLLALSVLHSDFVTGITHTSVVYFTWYSARIEYVAAHFFCFGWKRICLLMPVDGGYQ